MNEKWLIHYALFYAIDWEYYIRRWEIQLCKEWMKDERNCKEDSPVSRFRWEQHQVDGGLACVRMAHS